MHKSEAKVLIDAIQSLVDAKPLQLTAKGNGVPAADNPDGYRQSPLPADDGFEKLYQRVKRRFIDEAQLDPVLLHLLTVRPEIVVEVERQIITLDGSTLKGRVARLLAQGWFHTTRATGAARKELGRTGADPGGGGALSDVLAGLVRDGFLVRDGDGYTIAAGVAVTESRIEK